MPEGIEKDLYFVAVKILLRDGNKLLITHDIFKSWDVPGGRIRANEFSTPLENVLARKMNEELGPHIRYALGKPVVTFRVERIEHSLNKQVRIFAIGYEATYLGGDIILGDHHDKMEWVDITDFKPEDYFTGGWLVGIQDYLALSKV